MSSTANLPVCARRHPLSVAAVGCAGWERRVSFARNDSGHVSAFYPTVIDFGYGNRSNIARSLTRNPQGCRSRSQRRGSSRRGGCRARRTCSGPAGRHLNILATYLRLLCAVRVRAVTRMVPVVDLFAGPGGLAACRRPDGRRRYRIETGRFCEPSAARRLPGALRDHLQVGLPHVRAHEVQRRAACGAEPVEETLQMSRPCVRVRHTADACSGRRSDRPTSGSVARRRREERREGRRPDSERKSMGGNTTGPCGEP